jgi:hypothetical protein
MAVKLSVFTMLMGALIAAADDLAFVSVFLASLALSWVALAAAYVLCISGGRRGERNMALITTVCFLGVLVRCGVAGCNGVRVGVCVGPLHRDERRVHQKEARHERLGQVGPHVLQLPLLTPRRVRGDLSRWFGGESEEL